MKNKTYYRLLKDLPFAKAGEILESRILDDGKEYIFWERYRLLKDLPFAKAGEILESRILDDGEEYLFWGEIKTEKIENFDEWFEEIKSSEIPDELEMGFWTIDFEGYFFGSGGAYPKYITNDHLS